MEDPGQYNLTFSQLSLQRLPSFVMGAVYFDRKVPTPKKGRSYVLSKFWFPFTCTITLCHNYTVPHAQLHCATCTITLCHIPECILLPPIMKVVLCSELLVPTYQTTQRHISEETNPYLKPRVMYVCMCVSVSVSFVRLQAKAAVQLRPSLYLDVIRCRLVSGNGRFGTACQAV